MTQIPENLKATTLLVWYDLVTGGYSVHDRIKNEATTKSLNIRDTVQSGEEMNIAECAAIYGE